MPNQRYILILPAVLKLSCVYSQAPEINDLAIDREAHQTGAAHTSTPEELNSAQIVAIGSAMVTYYKEFLTSRTVQLARSSCAFEFLIHKKAKKYKIPRDGCIDLLRLDRFISCLSEDIRENEAEHNELSDLCMQYENGAITQKAYLEDLSLHGITAEHNVQSYLDKIKKDTDKFTLVIDELKTLKNQEKEARTRDFTFENAIRYLPESLTTNSTVRGLAEAYVRENFFPTA